MSSDFVYDQRLNVDQIRLLRIHPNNPDQPLEYDIVTRELTRDVEYTALSYVWGSISTLKQATCNGQSVGITESLYGALLRYRANGSSGLLWADAHSINQNDNVEKSEQVQLMARIYEQASLVIFWLGEESISDAAGLELAQKLYDVFKDSTLDTTNWSPGDFEAAGAPVTDVFRWKAFMALLNRPWFRRIWIMQEFISARAYVMWCGRLVFKPEILLVTASMLTKRRHTAIIANAFDQEELTPFVSLLGDTGTLWALNGTLGPRGNRNCRLAALLWPLRAWKASDIRDKVFALVGLADGPPLGFVNYDLSARQVFVQTAKFVLWDNSFNPLIMLSFITVDEKGEIPTWVPTWTINPYMRTPLASRYRFYTPPQELLEPRAEYQFISGDTLAIKGKILDNIFSLHACPYTSQSITTQAFTLQITETSSWLNICARLIQDSPRYGSGRAAEEALWRMMILDSTSPRAFASGFAVPGEDYRRSFQAFRAYMQVDSEPDTAAAAEIWRSRRQEYLAHSQLFQNSMGNYMSGRQTCATRSGYVGCGPLHARLGDRICIFQGYPIPFAIRPTDQDGCFELVGEVYLHGLMNGEAIRLTDAPLEMIKLI